MKQQREIGIWICHECGRKYGRYRANCSTWHEGECDYCEQIKEVTEARDYGYPYLPEDCNE